MAETPPTQNEKRLKIPLVTFGLKVEVQDLALYHSLNKYEKERITKSLRAVFKELVRRTREAEKEAETREAETIKVDISVKPEIDIPSAMLELNRRLERANKEIEKLIEEKTRYLAEIDTLKSQLEQLKSKSPDKELQNCRTELEKKSTELAKAKEILAELLALLEVASTCVKQAEVKHTLVSRLTRLGKEYGSPRLSNYLQQLKAKCEP